MVDDLRFTDDLLLKEIFASYDYLPPGPILLLSTVLDSIPFIGSTWRQFVPFGLANPPDGMFSYHVPTLSWPPLREFVDVPGGLKEFLFEAENTILGDLTHPVSLAVVVMVAFLLNRFKVNIVQPFFHPIGQHLATTTHGKGWVQNNPERIYKFSEYCFRLCYHASMSLFGLWVFSRDTWWLPKNGGMRNLWINFPHHNLSPEMIWYTILQAGYNVEAMYSLLVMSFDIQFKGFPQIKWSKTVRGDFREMFVHHIITNALTFGSSHFRSTRIEATFLILHDLSDVPVDLSKLCHFLKWKNSTVVVFTIMTIVWAITRLFILPFECFRSLLFESHIVLIEKSVPPLVYFCYRPFFLFLVGSIIFLHCLWFFMMLKMFSKFFRVGEIHDLSEHKRGENLDGSKKKN